MEEFYVQAFGNKRIIQVRGWTDKDALLYDLKTGLEYAMAWSVFFAHHNKLDTFDMEVSDYEGADLDRVKETIKGNGRKT